MRGVMRALIARWRVACYASLSRSLLLPVAYHACLMDCGRPYKCIAGETSSCRAFGRHRPARRRRGRCGSHVRASCSGRQRTRAAGSGVSPIGDVALPQQRIEKLPIVGAGLDLPH